MRNHLNIATTRTKKYYDLRVPPLKYKAGNSVYFFSHGNILTDQISGEESFQIHTCSNTDFETIECLSAEVVEVETICSLH